MTLIVPVLLALALVQLAIGLGILFQSRRSKQLHQKLFVAVLTVLLFWTLTSTILAYVDTHASPQNVERFNAVNRVSFLMGAASIVLIYLFNAFYPVQRRVSWFRKLIFGLGGLMIVLAPSQLVSGLFAFEKGELTYQYGLLSGLFIFYTLIVLSSLVFDTISLYRSAVSNALKRQAVTILLGLSLTVVHALMFIIILPIFLGNQPILYGIGYLAPYFYTSFTAYSLVKQGLFDLRAVVVRAVAYVLSMGLLVISAGGIVLIVSLLLAGDELGLEQAILISFISIVIASVYQPIIRWFNRVTNRLFYRDAYSPQVLIDELNKILVSTIELREMLKEVSQLVASTLRTDLCFFTLHNREGAAIVVGAARGGLSQQERVELQKIIKANRDPFVIVEELDHSRRQLKAALEGHRANLILPMIDAKHGFRITGYMALGEKKNGSTYNHQDIEVLTIIANELVIATQNAMRFEEIQGFNLTLQERVDEKTKKLRKTNERLRVLDQTKDDFISMASHQLRTPLTSVKGYVSMVLDGDGGAINETQRKLLNQSFISAQRMTYLISDLLNVSRLRTGKFIIETMPTDLDKVIGEELDQLQETVRSRGLELEYHHPEHFPVLMLDETKLRQVIMNFVDNAIYYTPSGGRIDVYLTEKPESIEFTVVDTGIGVPKHEQHHLFTKFYRAKNAKSARPDGTGLGIFMAKKVIIAQGGAVIFKSTEGKGSTFGFTFPKAKLLPKTDTESH